MIGRPAEAVSAANVRSMLRDHPGCLFYMPRPCVLTRFTIHHHVGAAADWHDARRFVQDLRKASSLLPLRLGYLRLCRARPQQRGVAGGHGTKQALALACLWCLQAARVPRLLGEYQCGQCEWSDRMLEWEEGERQYQGFIAYL